ncbi:hypothetical protein [Rubrivirga sp.]|uniref:hypothetical protein n=1 Tax=Rubrivirga sp. TaxID=1885344 RepID=UPI003C74C56D
MRLAAAALLVVLSACDTIAEGPQIVRYSGPPITEADAVETDGYGGPRLWSVDWIGLFSGTTVTIRRTLLCGDECGQTTQFRFTEEGDGGLPTSIEGSIILSTWPPDNVSSSPLLIDRVEIQDWGPEIYSGIVYAGSGRLAQPVPFWSDDVSVAVE